MRSIFGTTPATAGLNVDALIPIHLGEAVKTINPLHAFVVFNKLTNKDVESQPNETRAQHAVAILNAHEKSHNRNLDTYDYRRK